MYALNLVGTIWWLFFFTALGLCVGSFLNVVIYRLPLGIALTRPVWSFCPHCGQPIRWIDNLPVISYLRLRGRCWSCWEPISPRYGLIELTTAITVILLFDSFFITQSRDGLVAANDVTWRLSEDWPIFIAHVILFSSLLAMSVIDMQFYWVDIRFTHLAAAAGIASACLWTPYHSRHWLMPHDGTLVATVSMFAVFAIIWIALQLRSREAPRVDQPADQTVEPLPDVVIEHPQPSIAPLLPPLALLMFLLVACAAGAGENLAAFTARAIACLVFFFLLIIYGGSHRRDADTEIIEAIEEEAPHARGMALRETAVLVPALVVGMGVLFLVLREPSAMAIARRIIHWQPLRGEWQPVWGLARGINGYVIAAGIGWTIRIIATLGFGKEAFATGDIHMMAAAGAVLGWQVVLVGFVLACFLAVAGWLLLLPFKRSRAIPLGPWLWIGFLSATLFYKPLAGTQVVRAAEAVTQIIFFNSQAPLFEGGP